jgi:hypothetical protein
MSRNTRVVIIYSYHRILLDIDLTTVDLNDWTDFHEIQTQHNYISELLSCCHQ